VGLVLNMLTGYTRSIATGFARYARETGNWSIVVAHDQDLLIVLGYEEFDCLDGVVAGYSYGNLQHIKCPIVYSLTPEHAERWPVVCPDNGAVGKLAADHLISIGFPYFSFAGLASMAHSTERRQGFEAALSAHRRKVQAPMLFPTWHDVSASGSKQLRDWLSNLLLPCAVFCADDRIAGTVAIAAHAVGLHIPEQLAILGVNNDDLTCTATVPALSSISIGGEAIGYEAARQLDRCMQDPASIRPTVTRVTPQNVVERGSTQVLGYSDFLVCEAMRLIRARAGRELVMVDQIAAELGVHRQQLNRSFLACVGHSPKEEIDRVRADRLRALLLGSSIPLKKISYEMGFASPSHLVRFCGRMFEKTPMELSNPSTP